MTDAEKALLVEALELLDKAVNTLDSMQGSVKIHILAKVIHGAISVGEMML